MKAIYPVSFSILFAPFAQARMVTVNIAYLTFLPPLELESLWGRRLCPFVYAWPQVSAEADRA
jgi:hypothetical protein